MKLKLFLAALLFIIPASISALNAQPFSAGVSGNSLLNCKYLKYQSGPVLFLQYSLNNIPVFVRGNMRYYYAGLSPENNLSFDYDYNSVSFGASVNYYPVDWYIVPYVSAGIYYNINTLTRSGQPQELMRVAKNIKNNISAEIMAGGEVSINSFHFFAGITQVFNQPGYLLDVNPLTSGAYSAGANFNFNSLFYTLGFYVGI